MTTEQAAKWTLTLTDEERIALLRLLDEAVRDIHAERRRTEAPAYQAAVSHDEAVLRALEDKVRRLGS